MLSMLMTTEYAPAEDRHELQQLLIHIAGGEREALAELSLPVSQVLLHLYHTHFSETQLHPLYRDVP